MSDDEAGRDSADAIIAYCSTLSPVEAGGVLAALITPVINSVLADSDPVEAVTLLVSVAPPVMQVIPPVSLATVAPLLGLFERLRAAVAASIDGDAS